MIPNSSQSIPCPTCQTEIPFDVQQLLNGAKFSCPTCDSAISLGGESIELVKESLEKFGELKNKSQKS